MEADLLTPGQYAITNDNSAGWIVVAALTSFIYTVGLVAVKLMIRYKVVGWKHNDTALAFGTGILFAQTACVVWACNHGLGQRQAQVSGRDLAVFSKVCWS